MRTIKEILDFFEKQGLEIIKNQVDLDHPIIAPRNIMEANENHITFISRKLEKNFLEILKEAKSKLILVESELFQKAFKEDLPMNIAFVKSENPKKDLVNCIYSFFIQEEIISQIHSTSVIADNVKLGDKVNIGPNVVIEENVEIGDGCIIEANTVIKKETLIGNHVIIKASSVIGGTGFGYVKEDNDSTYRLIPHLGKVIIEDDVHIGSNTCIDRGSMSDTIIKKGVKIDNLVHIAHNVKIGENSLIIASTMIAGSVEIDKNCLVAPCVSIRNGLKINKNSTLGLGSVVTSDVDEDTIVAGVPAIDLKSLKIIRDHHKEILKSHKQ